MTKVAFMRAYPWGRAALVAAFIAATVGCGSGDTGKTAATGGTAGTDSGLTTGGSSNGGNGGLGGSGGTSTGGTDAGGGGGAGGTAGADAGPDSSTDAGQDGSAGGKDAGKDAAQDADAGDGAPTTCTVTADCKDTNLCDGITTCVAGKCVVAPSPTCTNGGDPCKEGACDPASGCFQRPLTGASCNDNDACTPTDICVSGVCTGTGSQNCDDSNPCTDDTCSASTGCTHTANTASCSDGNPCTINDVCSNKTCSGTTNSCDDGNPCTSDTCDQLLGCQNAPVTDGTSCPSDGNVCTLDTCVGGQCHTAAPAATICRSASCTNGTATDQAVCGGSTTCPAPVTASCSPNPCNSAGTGCQGTCAADTDCPNKYYCDTLTGTCLSQKPLGGTCSRNGQCSNNQCVDGVCCASACGGGNPNDCVVCNATPGSCTPLDGVTCNDGNACTSNDACITGACIGVTVLCDDGNPCTADACDKVLGCTTPPAPNGTACNDNNACTTSDTCQGGTCTGSAPLPCDDGIYCNGTETCSAQFGCQAGTPVVCADDGRSCTAEFCDEGLKACRTVVQDSLCSNGLFCDGAEKCDPTNPSSNATTGCTAGTPPTCNDGISCTTDACNESQKKCTFTASNAACSDGNACNGTEICDAASGCKSGTPITCNDGVYCTTDSCNPANGACVFSPTNTLCDNGIYCDGTEICDPAAAPGPNGCKAGTAVSCPPSDVVNCTVDVCDETTRSCVVKYDNTLCTSGQVCTAGGCSSTSCTSDANCTDGNACNGTETCDLSLGSPGHCVAGTPITCNDGKSCTADSCNPSTGACVYTASTTACNDGNLCNGTESCNPSAPGANATTGCVAGTALSCNLGKSCATYGCNPSTGCTITTGTCPDDGNLCNGGAVCQPTNPQSDANGCVATPPVSCPSTGCATGTCNPTTGTCSYLADSTKCPCGQQCDSTGACGNFCTVTTCQGKVYECGDCVDNDGDCGVDTISDKDCLGPCQNNESGFYGNIPGQNNAPCKMDCYFDADTGAGNDGCYWSKACDPLSVAPNYYPANDSTCACVPTNKNPPPYPNCSENIAGTSSTCADLYTLQSTQCWQVGGDPATGVNYCGALVPNGCDCFGCCVVPGAPTPVFLGSQPNNSGSTGTCTLSTLNDPTKCHPCTQVPSCANPCDKCEICIGKPLPDPSCSQQTCPAGQTLCGGSTGLTCASGYFCLTGCCVKVPT